MCEIILALDRGDTFLKYRQVDTKNKGTGLGLAIVHKIVETHAGHLSVDRIPDRGTRMIIRIPCPTQLES